MSRLVRCFVGVVVLSSSLAAYADELARKEIAAQYERLSVLSRSDQTEALARLDPEVVQDVWIVNMQRVMNEHPELTAEQRSVFYEAIGLANSGFAAILRGGTEQQKAAMKTASDHLLERARGVLPQAIIKAAFMELGPAEGRLPDLPRANRPSNVRSFWYCDCNNETYNGCGMGGFCISDGWSCIPTSGGCGYLGMYGCNGLCT